MQTHRPDPYRRPGSLEFFVDLAVPDGAPQCVPLGTADLAKARRLADELLARRAAASAESQAGHAGTALQLGRPADEMTPGTVHWALAEHLRRKAPELAEATRGMYAGQAGTLVRLLGARLTSSLHYADIERYVAARLAEQVVSETIRKELVLLRSALRTAFFLGVQVPDLFLLFPKLRSHYVPRRRWLTQDEFRALVQHLPPQRRLYVYVACYTGARRSELARILWQDVDWLRSAMHLRGTKTEAAARVVPLHPDLCAILRPLAGRPTAPVLHPWGNVCRDLAEACAELGFPRVTPNDLRRTFGSWLVQANISAHTVAKLMGHTTEKMVNQVYGHLDDHALRRAVEKLPSGGETQP
jgi:integrase